MILCFLWETEVGIKDDNFLCCCLQEKDAFITSQLKAKGLTVHDEQGEEEVSHLDNQIALGGVTLFVRCTHTAAVFINIKNKTQLIWPLIFNWFTCENRGTSSK